MQIQSGSQVVGVGYNTCEVNFRVDSSLFSNLQLYSKQLFFPNLNFPAIAELRNCQDSFNATKSGTSSLVLPLIASLVL